MKRDLHQFVTDQIIADLERGVAPWEKPWKDNGAGAGIIGIPMNASTGKTYRGINILTLWIAGAKLNTNDLRFVTFKQAKGLGGSVVKGSRGFKVYFYTDWIKVDDDGEQRRIPVLKEYTVFHVSQVDGCNELFRLPTGVGQLPSDTAEFCDMLEATVHHGSNRACYVPALDVVNMPAPADFVSLDAYRNVLYHELTHWTGHESRINRNLAAKHARDAYAREELIAELGAAFICAEFGLAYETRHAAYLQSWLRVLKDDKRAIFQAASAAQKAVDWMRGKVNAAPTAIAA